jgi:hypothetical protein
MLKKSKKTTIYKNTLNTQTITELLTNSENEIIAVFTLYSTMPKLNVAEYERIAIKIRVLRLEPTLSVSVSTTNGTCDVLLTTNTSFWTSQVFNAKYTYAFSGEGAKLRLAKFIYRVLHKKLISCLTKYASLQQKQGSVSASWKFSL